MRLPGSPKANPDALFGLAFATAPPHGLTSPHTSTRRLILQKARHHTTPHKENAGALTACRHMVSGTISQPLTGALFTFPSRYSSTIGHQGYLGLPRGRGRFTRNYTSSELLGTTPKEDAQVSPTGLSPSTVGHPKPVRLPTAFYHSPPARQNQQKGNPTTPHTQHLPTITRARFSLFPFRSPLLRESHIVFFSSGY